MVVKCNNVCKTECYKISKMLSIVVHGEVI